MNPASNPDEADVLARAVDEANRWVEETAKALPRREAELACSALRAVLQALRDSLPFDEAVKLGNHVPAIIRSMYYEGWNPRIQPTHVTRKEFLARVAGRVAGLEPEQAISAVFQALRKLAQGTMAHWSSGWPRVLLEFGLIGTVEADGAEPSPLDPVRMKAAIERAEIDGAPIDVAVSSERTGWAPSESVFDKAVQKTNLWIKELMRDTGWADPLQAFTVLLGTLEALRDRVGREEALDLGAQLPLALRGCYFDSWNPDLNPADIRTMEDFRSAIAERLTGVFDIEPDRAAIAVFRLLDRQIPGRELDHVRSRLPKQVRDLWPDDSVKPAGRAHAGPRAGLRKARKEVRAVSGHRRLTSRRGAVHRKP